jgi:uncharacterized protein Yka (UPF0111/DUF47 family)
MKKSKELNKFHDELLSHFDNINILMTDYKKKIKKEYQQLLIEEKNKLLLKIAEGEKLNINDLKNKYLKVKEITPIETQVPSTEENEDLLDKIVIEGDIYYYENKEKGKVFDINNIEVGTYKSGSILLN